MKKRYWLLAPLVAAGLVFMGCEDTGDVDDGFNGGGGLDTPAANGGTTGD
jgi:hypothetical protein